MGRIRARLAGLGADTTEKIVEVINDGLKAKRWVVITCVKCGHRNRKNLADQATRNATVKLAHDLAAPSETPGIGTGGAWAFDETVDIYDPNVSTRVVAASAFPEREQWLETRRVDGTLAARCERAAGVHRRWRDGRHVTEEELAEARTTAHYVLTVTEQMAPAVGLDFDKARVTAPTTTGGRFFGRRASPAACCRRNTHGLVVIFAPAAPQRLSGADVSARLV